MDPGVNLCALICLASAALALYVAGHTFRAARIERWRDQRWFALTSLTAALYIGLDVGDFLDVSRGLRVGLDTVQLAIACAHVACWMVFSERVLGAARTRLDRVLFCALALTSVAGLIPNAVYSTASVVTIRLEALHSVVYQPESGPLGAPLYALILLALLRPLTRFWKERRANPEASWYFYGLVLLLLCGVNDACVAANLYAGPLLLDAGFVLPIAAAAMVQTDRLVRTARDLDELSERLEREVHERSQALVQARASLDRSERLAAIGQLAAGVAHEVNNPAAALQANLSYLKRAFDLGESCEDAGECLEESIASVQRIAKIVRQLRDSARAAASHADLEPVELRAVADAALAAVKTDLRPEQVHVEVPAGLHAAGTEGYLVQVLTNLLLNAVQATPAGATPEITVRGVRRDDGVILEVLDRGSGMSRETTARLFEPFFTTKPVGKGTGLGLAVSRGLVQSMGGALEVESALGQGTTVRLALRAASAPVRAPAPPQELHASRRRLVLIDDDPQVRHALARELAQRFEIVAAEGVQDGLMRLVGGPAPDLVLCDLVMSDGGGARLYQLLAAAHPTLARKMVFVTGGAITPEDERFLAAQPQPVLMKPLVLDELMAAAEQVAP